MKHFIRICLPVLMLLGGCVLAFGQTPTHAPTHADTILYQLYHPSPERVLVIAHRGAWAYAPENSLAAVQRCIDMGVDVVEMDFQLTRDGYLVAMHDQTVDRTTNGKGKVSEMTLAEIKALRLRNACGVKGSLHQVPTLEEVMLLAKGKILINLDKTEGKTLKESFEVLKKTGTLQYAILKGNDPIDFMRAKYGSIMDSVIYMPKVWYDLPDILGYVKAYNEGISPPIYEMLFDNTDSPVFKLIPEMKKNGITVLSIALWDELCAGHTDESALLKGPDGAWGWLVDQGANAIMTDAPELLLDYLRSRKLHR